MLVGKSSTWQKFEPTWANYHVIGEMFIEGKGQILKKIISIWSHLLNTTT